MDIHEQIISEFAECRNQVQALPMAKYMRFQFEFLGIPRPERTCLQKAFLQNARREAQIKWEFVWECWRKKEREYQYLGIDYLQALAKQLQPEDMARLEYLIKHRSWWDTVDIIAIKLVGGLCSRYPHLIMEYIIPWSQADNIWLRRSAVLFQLKYKQATDFKLLGKVIEANCERDEFFIKKAIGWSLREYSKTDPDWVREFISSHRLSSLSIREGSKYIPSEAEHNEWQPGRVVSDSNKETRKM